jgi:hypothetical protein
MGVRKEQVERRKHMRFQASCGAFAVLRPQSSMLGQNIDILGQIIDIGMGGGLALRYIASEKRSHESCELDIVLARNGFHVDKVPFQTASDFKIANKTSLDSVPMRRLSVQFGKVTHDQEAQLGYFIRHHTFGCLSSQSGKSLGPVVLCALTTQNYIF